MKKYIYVIVFLALCGLQTAAAQTLKALSYNTTNGQVTYTSTNTLTFTNPINIGVPGETQLTSFGVFYGNNVIISWEDQAFFEEIAFEQGFNFGNGDPEAAADISRANLRLGASDSVTFSNLFFASREYIPGESNRLAIELGSTNTGINAQSANQIDFFVNGLSRLQIRTNNVSAGLFSGSFEVTSIAGGIVFSGLNSASITRTNLGLGWSALTNTNAATFQTALFGTNVVIDTEGITLTNNGEVITFGGSESLYQVSSYLGVGWKTGGEFSGVRIFSDGIYSGPFLATNKIITFGLDDPFWRLETAPTFASGVATEFINNLGLTNGGASLNVNAIVSSSIDAATGSVGAVDFSSNGVIYAAFDDGVSLSALSLSPEEGLSFSGSYSSQAKGMTRAALDIGNWSTSIQAHHSTGLSPASGGQTYYFGFPHDLGAITTPTDRGFRFPFNGKIIAATASISVGGTLGTATGTNAAIGIFNKTTSTPISFGFTNLVWSADLNTDVRSNLSIPVNSTNEYAFYVVTPTFSVSPTSVRHYVTLFFQAD